MVPTDLLLLSGLIGVPVCVADFHEVASFLQ